MVIRGHLDMNEWTHINLHRKDEKQEPSTGGSKKKVPGTCAKKWLWESWAWGLLRTQIGLCSGGSETWFLRLCSWSAAPNPGLVKDPWSSCGTHSQTGCSWVGGRRYDGCWDLNANAPAWSRPSPHRPLKQWRRSSKTRIWVKGKPEKSEMGLNVNSVLFYLISHPSAEAVTE